MLLQQRNSREVSSSELVNSFAPAQRDETKVALYCSLFVYRQFQGIHISRGPPERPQSANVTPRRLANSTSLASWRVNSPRLSCLRRGLCMIDVRVYLSAAGTPSSAKQTAIPS